MKAIIFAALLASAASGARAEATCNSVGDDLTGKNVYGQHTMMQLLQATKTGDCSAAAYLSRRAKDAEGFLGVHCPAQASLLNTATAYVRAAQETLHTAECQD